jgi:hypothetical protein
MTGWGCAPNSLHSNLPKRIIITVERSIKKKYIKECELRTSLTNNTQFTLYDRAVKYEVKGDNNELLVERDYQENNPLNSGQIGDKKSFKVEGKECSSSISLHILKFKVSGIFRWTHEPDPYIEILDICEDPEKTLYPFHNCKKSRWNE